MNRNEIIISVISILKSTPHILNKKNIISEEKSGIGNIVTQIDKELESLIIQSLRKKFPFAYVIGEESADEILIDNTKCDLKFIVDPLDGTTNYTNGWPHTISIGIADDKELFGGVVYDVLSDKIYFGIKDNGVYYCNINSTSDIKKIEKPSYDVEDIKKSIISFDTPYRAEAYELTKEMMNNLYYEGASLKTVGPISLDVLKTALSRENRPHDYNNAVWHTEVRAWDLAASSVILREFGGEIIGADGKPLSYETLTSPTEKITFIASGNSKMLYKLSQLYMLSKNKIISQSIILKKTK